MCLAYERSWVQLLIPPKKKKVKEKKCFKGKEKTAKF
jgi:hypothetical protein